MYVRAIALMLAASAPLCAQDGEVRVTPLAIGKNIIAVTAPSGADADPVTAARLAQRVTIDFNEVDMEQVADFFYRNLSVSIVLDPEVRANPGAPISLAVSNMTGRVALEWCVRQAGLHMGYMNQAIYISTEPVRGAERTVLYDVTDLVSPVVDFPGPELALNAVDAGTGLDGLFQMPDDGPEAPFTVDDLAELIEEHINTP